MAASASESGFERSVLITGGCGFIASHVVILMVKKYPTYRIVCLDKLDYCASLKNLDSVMKEPNFSFVQGDITSASLVNYVMLNEKIDYVMHFAAQTHVDNSFGNSFTFTINNILGTHVMLEASKQRGVKLFLHVSTDEVYGDGESGLGHKEDTSLDPTNPYAATKAGAEYLVKAYARSFKLPTIITRGNNVYGPHQYPEKVVPKFILQAHKGRALTLHGDGSNTRNYLYVADVARAFDVVFHKGSVGEIYNIGGDNELSNLEVARSILKALDKEGDGEEKIILVPDRPFNDLRYPLDSSKLVELGWKEETSWEAGLSKCVEWYTSAMREGHWGSIESALVAHPRRGQQTTYDDVHKVMGGSG